MRTTIPTEYTQPVTFMRGEYSLGNYTIPYFSTILPFGIVAKSLELFENFPNSEDIAWDIKELFQRDIAWDRVETEIKRYLDNERHPHFFNALTVALLPKARGEDSQTWEFDEEAKVQPLLEEGLVESVNYGGIQISSFLGDGELDGRIGGAGRLRWDPRRIIPIAVDGQHRLAAIKKYCEGLSSDAVLDAVPVIFLVPHQEFGYREPGTSEHNMVESLRRIFIDLNKNARPVSQTRNILLDDNDIVSVCTRSLIGERLQAEGNGERLPLGIIDWSSGKGKFDTGPFITTVVTLNQIVSQVIDWNKVKRSEPTGPSDSNTNYRNQLKRAFGLDDGTLDDLMNEVEACQNVEVPVTFQREEVAKIEAAFIAKYRSIFFKVLTNLLPYKDLLSYAEDNDMLQPRFVNLYILDKVAKNSRARQYKFDQILEKMRKDPDVTWNQDQHYEAPLAHVNEELKKDNWFYKVVFQKALFESLFTLLNQAEEFNFSEDEDSEIAFVDFWISSMNTFVEKGFASEGIKSSQEYFWNGIGRNAVGNIEYTNVSISRISNWLNVWVYMSYLANTEGSIPQYRELTRENEGVKDFLAKSVLDYALGLPEKLVVSTTQEVEDIDAHKTEIVKKRYKILRSKFN